MHNDMITSSKDKAQLKLMRVSFGLQLLTIINQMCEYFFSLLSVVRSTVADETSDLLTERLPHVDFVAARAINLLQQFFPSSVPAANSSSSTRQLLVENLWNASTFLIPSQSNQTQIMALNQTGL